MSLLTVRLVTCIVLNKKLSWNKIKTPKLCGDSEKLSNKKKSNDTWSYIYSVYVKQMSFLKYKYGTIHTVQPINLYHTHWTLCSSKTKVSNTLNSVPNFSVKSLFSGAFNVSIKIPLPGCVDACFFLDQDLVFVTFCDYFSVTILNINIRTIARSYNYVIYVLIILCEYTHVLVCV